MLHPLDNWMIGSEQTKFSEGSSSLHACKCMFLLSFPLLIYWRKELTPTFKDVCMDRKSSKRLTLYGMMSTRDEMLKSSTKSCMRP